MLFDLVFNIMMKTISGEQYFGEGMGDVKEVKQFQQIVEETFALSGASNLLDFLPVLNWVDFCGIRKRLERLQTKRDELLQNLIEERKKMRSTMCCGDEEEEQGKKTLIDVLLSLQESDPEYYTDQIIKGILVVRKCFFRKNPCLEDSTSMWKTPPILPEKQISAVWYAFFCAERVP